MTIWTPNLPRRRPAYLELADAVGADRDCGRLAPGDRLPPHRALAFALGLTVGTVTRGYQEAARRGLVQGEVGRGTFVAAPAGAPAPADAAFGRRQAVEPDVLNLTITRPAIAGLAAPLERTLAAVLARGLDGLIDYGPPEGAKDHRQAVAGWIGRPGSPIAADRVVIASGAQNGLAMAAAGLLRPGDRIAVDPLTYPGFKAAAGLFGLKLAAVPGDADGMRPDLLAKAARQGAVAVYLMPTLHNPTMATMPAGRRREIAAAAREAGLLILEDDVYGFLAPDAPPRLADLAPERTALIGSVSKFMAPSLRVGWLVPPADRVADVAGVVRGLAWMASPLTAAVAAEAIRSGLAAELAAAQRREAAARIAIAAGRLAPWLGGTPAAAMHLWLTLPSPWRTGAFVAEAEARRIAVTGAGAFAVGRGQAPHAIRLGLGAAERDRLDVGLKTLADLLAAPPRSGAAVV